MSHIDAEIEVQMATMKRINEKNYNYDIERFSKNGKYKAIFKGNLKITEVGE